MTKALYSGIPSTPKLVLVVLCDCANDDTLSCYPSIGTIAKRASLSRRQTQRILTWLEDRGVVEVVKNPSGGRPGDTKHYQINTDKITETGDTHDTGDKLTRVTSVQRGVTFATETGDTHDTRTVMNRNEPSLGSDTPKKRKRATQVTDDFNPNDQHRNLGRELGVDVDFERGKFVDYCLATGKAYKNWDAAFRNWLRNSVKFGGGGKTQERTQSVGMFPDD